MSTAGPFRIPTRFDWGAAVLGAIGPGIARLFG